MVVFWGDVLVWGLEIEIYIEILRGLVLLIEVIYLLKEKGKVVSLLWVHGNGNLWKLRFLFRQGKSNGNNGNWSKWRYDYKIALDDEDCAPSSVGLVL